MSEVGHALNLKRSRGASGACMVQENRATHA